MFKLFSTGFDSNLMLDRRSKKFASPCPRVEETTKGEDKFEIFLKNLRIQKFAVFDYGNSNNKAEQKVGLYFDHSASTKKC